MSDPHAADAAAPKGGKKKLLIVIIVGVTLLLGGGGAAFYFLQGGAPEAADGKHKKDAADHGEHEEEATDEHGDAGHGDSEDEEAEDAGHGEEEEEAPAEGGGGGHGEGGAVAGANYLPLDPPFIVNFQQEQGKKPRVRFLKVEVQCLTKTPAQLEIIKAHSPMLRNKLIMLFSNQKYEDLASSEGIEKLRVAALEEVKKALKETTGKKTVKDLYFTSFVMQ
jgi:flagellar protein FliL